MRGLHEPRQLLLVEDDRVFAGALGRALTRRGFEVTTAFSHAEAMARLQGRQPDYAVVDLRLGEDNGLRLIPELRSAMPTIRILLLTGYASIATAVEAIKRGADDYLAKPVDADAVVRALLASEPENAGEDALPATAMPLRRVEWEHIQRTLLECDGNISEAARRLGLHRRTLQRRLDKRPVRERPEDNDW